LAVWEIQGLGTHLTFRTIVWVCAIVLVHSNLRARRERLTQTTKLKSARSARSYFLSFPSKLMEGFFGPGENYWTPAALSVALYSIFDKDWELRFFTTAAKPLPMFVCLPKPDYQIQNDAQHAPPLSSFEKCVSQILCDLVNHVEL
jgi:hypothetical protein